MIVYPVNIALTIPVAVVALVMTGLLLIVIFSTLLSVPPALIAAILIGKTPGAVGVPEIVPETLFSVRPAGKPVAVKLVGLLVALIKYWNGALAVPVAVSELTITGGGGLMLMARLAVPVPMLLVALIGIMNEPAIVGVPEMTPVLGSIDSPGGSPVASNEVGLLVATML